MVLAVTYTLLVWWVTDAPLEAGESAPPSEG